MKYATVKVLASILHLWNNHGCGFVGRQQHGQSTHTVTEIFEQSHFYNRPEPESWVFKCNPAQWEPCLVGHPRTRASSRYARFLTRQEMSVWMKFEMIPTLPAHSGI